MAVTKRDLDQAFATYGDKYGGRREDYFAPLYLADEFKVAFEDAAANVAFGGNDYGFDAFFVSSQRRNLYLYQFKWSDSHSLFKDSLNRLVKAGMDRIFGNPLQDSRQNELLVRLKDELFENQAVIDRVFIQFVFNGDPQAPEQSAVLSSLREDLESKKFLVDRYFGERSVDLSVQFISNDTRRKGGRGTVRKTHEYQVPIEGHLVSTGPNGEQLHVGFLRLIDLYYMHKEMGSRLFERNIRSGLSADRPANRELRRALGRIVLDRTDSPKAFGFNHNGVAIAAESFAVADGHGRIVEPRILNGAQTVTSLAKFMDDNKDNPGLVKGREHLETCRVLTKIVSNADDRFVVNMTICNNRQNPVDPWNLRASDEIQLALQDKFIEELGVFYARQENSFEAMSDDDLDELGVDEKYKKIEIQRLAKTILAAQGELDKMSRMPDVFEDEKIYRNTFREAYLRTPAERILLAYKVQFRLLRLIREITERGVNKYGYLYRCRNLVWALLIQAMFNDQRLDKLREAHGRSLTMSAEFGEYLKTQASTKVRFVISDSLKDERSKSLLNEERYGFLRTKAMFDRCMAAAYERYGWTKRPL